MIPRNKSKPVAPVRVKVKPVEFLVTEEAPKKKKKKDA